MNKFRLDGLAVIKHINTRKEGPDDEKALAIDVKMEATVDAAYWDFFHEGLRTSLYTDVGAVRNPLMDAIGFSHSVRNCSLDLLGATFNEVEVSKFKMRAKDGNKAALTFAVSLSPRGNEVAQLAEFLQEETQVRIDPQPELDFDGGQSAGAADAVHDDEDPLYPQAVEVVQKAKRVSISLVQRHLRIGYNRAARLLEQMEGRGAVSAMNNDGNRTVLAGVAA